MSWCLFALACGVVATAYVLGLSSLDLVSEPDTSTAGHPELHCIVWKLPACFMSHLVPLPSPLFLWLSLAACSREFLRELSESFMTSYLLSVWNPYTSLSLDFLRSSHTTQATSRMWGTLLCNVTLFSHMLFHLPEMPPPNGLAYVYFCQIQPNHSLLCRYMYLCGSSRNAILSFCVCFPE